MWAKIKNKVIEIWKSEYFRAFWLIYLLGLICFSIEAADNHFTLPLTGDYTLQTYSYYSQGYHIVWDFFKTGQYPLFDFTNYLGANYLGTQSFYYVFSPLFYLLCLWPEKFLFQGIFFHMVFKFSLGGFFMYILLRKYFHVSKMFSYLGGFIFAFSGWALFYLWFHFSDVMAFFPLFIMGIEKLLKERKGWLLSLGLCLCGLANYFFLVNFCIFGMLYAIYRWIYIYGINKKRGYSAKERWGVLLQGVLYSVVGVMMTFICFAPSYYVVSTSVRDFKSGSYSIELLSRFFTNPTRDGTKFILGPIKPLSEMLKWENIKELFIILFVWDERTISSTTTISSASHYGYMLSNWLFMNTSCWDNILFDNVSLDNALGGFFITTPLTMLLIPSIAATIKSKRPWAIFGVIICLSLPFFPITAHIAFAFTSLYGRWQLWLVLIGILYIIPTLDKFELVNRHWVTLNLVINYVLAGVVYIISFKAGHLPTGDKMTVFGKEIPGLLLLVCIELLVMLVMWFIYRYKFIKVSIAKRAAFILTIVEIGASVVITVKNKGYHKWENYYLSQPAYSELVQTINDLKMEDQSFYRIFNTEASRTITNLPSQLNYAGSSSFNSTYNFELEDFKARSRMHYSGTWSMGNHEKRYWLDQYLGTKYYVIDKKDPNNDNGSYYLDETTFYNGRTAKTEQPQNYNINLPWNYELYKEGEYLDVYKNNAYIGIGYTVDNIINSTAIGKYKDSTLYEEMYSSMAIVEDDDAKTIKQLVPTIEQNTTYNAKYSSYSSNNWDFYFSPREDYSYWKEKNYDRHTYKLTTQGAFSQKEISEILPSSSQFLHKRWISKQRFGDELIMIKKDSSSYACPAATPTNKCYVDISFKIGPKVLISLYNGDRLITQDGHMVSNSSLGTYSTEWKIQRGFYVDSPFDKVVIEFVEDTKYNQLFYKNSSGKYDNLSVAMYYAYQEDMNILQQRVLDNLLENVSYVNNKFRFETNTNTNKLAVTTIPYDIGWALKVNGKKQDIFKVNGGFIGFVTPEGRANYELSYFTPKLKEGLAVTGFGLLLYIALGFVYKNKKINILVNETLEAEKYQQVIESQEKEELTNIKTKIINFFKKVVSYLKKLINKIFKKKGDH